MHRSGGHGPGEWRQGRGNGCKNTAETRRGVGNVTLKATHEKVRRDAEGGEETNKTEKRQKGTLPFVSVFFPLFFFSFCYIACKQFYFLLAAP